MKSVNVSKDKLLEVLRENRTKHVNEYLSAVEVYRGDVIARLRTMLENAQIEAGKVTPKFDLKVDLAEPVSYVDSYDTAIRMLDMSTDDIIELSSQEFSQYVEDNWAWQGMFKSITGTYNSKLA